MLASRDGKIVFENTVDARLEVVFRKKLPEVRSFSSSFNSIFLFCHPIIVHNAKETILM